MPVFYRPLCERAAAAAFAQEMEREKDEKLMLAVGAARSVHAIEKWEPSTVESLRWFIRVFVGLVGADAVWSGWL